MFNKLNLETVEKRFEDKRLRSEKDAEARRNDAESRNPELKRLGVLIRGTAVRVLEESMRGGEDLVARVQKIGRESLGYQKEYAEILKSMGLPEDYTKPHRDCTLCDDTGIVDGKMCTCMKREVVKESYRASGMGKLLQRQKFDTFDLSFYPTSLLPEKTYSARDVMKNILAELKDYAENFHPESSPSLLLIGGTGLGKTHLSTAIAGVVMEKGFDVVYESAPSVASLFEKDRFGREEGTKEKIARIMEAELLILDDLGTEPASQTSGGAFYQLINTRVAVNGLPTIINTNLTYRQLEKQYDTAILSRLLGEFEVKLFQGNDVRMAKLGM